MYTRYEIQLKLHEETLLCKEFRKETRKKTKLIRELILKDKELGGLETYYKDVYKHTIGKLGANVTKLSPKVYLAGMCICGGAKGKELSEYLSNVKSKQVYLRYLLVKYYKEKGSIPEDYVYGMTEFGDKGLREVSNIHAVTVKIRRVDLLEKLHTQASVGLRLRLLDMVCADIGLPRLTISKCAELGKVIQPDSYRYTEDGVEFYLYVKPYSELRTSLDIHKDVGSYIDGLLEKNVGEFDVDEASTLGRLRCVDLHFSDIRLWELFKQEDCRNELLYKLVREFYKECKDIEGYARGLDKFRSMKGKKYKHLVTRVADIDMYERVEVDFHRVKSAFYEDLLARHYKLNK